MKRTFTSLRLLFVLFTFFVAAAQAQSWDDRISDDRDLSWGSSLRLADVPLELAPDQTQYEAGGDGLNVVVYRMVKGQPVLQLNLRFTAGNTVESAGGDSEYFVETDGVTTAVGCAVGSTVHGSAQLASDHFTITNGSRNYRLVFVAPCGGTLSLIYNEDSPAGQALGIWQVASTAQQKLSETVGLDFWQRNIKFVFPAEADYYSWGTVHISRGDHWDVVGHEMGHAIYDQADIGAFGGGQHYIDRCYSGALALSEGWASYFSSWVNVDLNDADAKFEYMVPRRAPIRFENVPEDVCEGPGSEWRVNAFFWDFIDLNDDSEQTNETFARVWAALVDGNSRDVAAASQRLVRAGFDTTVVDALWALNFRQNR